MKLFYDLLDERLVPEFNGTSRDSNWREGYHHFEFNDYVGFRGAKNQPDWYKSLKLFKDAKNKKELLIRYLSKSVTSGPFRAVKTAKSCPAFINFFKQSISLKTPTDIFIDIQRLPNDNYTYTWGTNDNFWAIEHHDEDQCGHLARDYIVLKLSHSFSWTTSEDCQYQYIDPYMMNSVPYRILPGIITQKKGMCAFFNMPVLIPKIEGRYCIEAGSTLAYLQFDKPVRSIDRKDLTKEMKKSMYRIHVTQDNRQLLGKS